MQDLVDAITNMREERVYELTRDYLADGKAPEEIFEAYQSAMKEIGRRFEAGTYFVPELIMAGEMMKNGSAIIRPVFSRNAGEHTGRKIGRLLLATIEGDIHDIGKDIVHMMMEFSGFEVLDLGVDVPPAVIIEQVKEFRPDVVGISGLLTLAFDPMKRCVEMLAEEGLRENCKVVLGGAQLDQQVCEYIGADAFVTDAVAGVSICKKWVAA